MAGLVSGGALTFESLRTDWINAGGPPGAADTAAAIAFAESNGYPNANNPNDPIGNGQTQSAWGLWELGDGTHNAPPNWDVPSVNAQLAVAKYKAAGYSFSPWGTYTTPGPQNYVNFLPGTVGYANDEQNALANPYVGLRAPPAELNAATNATTVPTSAAPIVTGNAPDTSSDPLGIVAWLSGFQSTVGKYWAAHPLWLLLAGIVLVIVAWGLLGGPQETAALAGTAAGAASKASQE